MTNPFVLGKRITKLEDRAKVKISSAIELLTKSKKIYADYGDKSGAKYRDMLITKLKTVHTDL